MQFTSSGSGSHSLFLIHTDAFGPVEMNPEGQMYVMNCPSIMGISDSLSTIITRSCIRSDCVDGSSQVTACRTLYTYAYYNI